MNIEVVGAVCSNCNDVETIVRKVVEVMKVDAKVVRVDAPCGVVRAGIRMTPALKINGNEKCVGRVPSPKEVRDWILEEMKNE